MGWKITVDEIKSVFYQCKFRQCLQLIDDALLINDVPDAILTLNLIKVQALFELHKVKQAKDLLASLRSQGSEEADTYIYVTAKLSYFDDDFEKAERLFKLLSDRSESVKDYFKANLGLANVYYSTKRYRELLLIQNELEEIVDLIAIDERLSFWLFKANTYYFASGLVNDSKRLFHSVMKESSRWGWNYFTAKSLYGLATVAQERSRSEELEATLQILRCYLDLDETVYLTYLVNEQFKESDYTITSPVQLDPENKRVNVRGQWVGLHDKPLLYKFIELLNNTSGFVAKEKIAQYLWDEEEYKPRMHDPRIFDIARRIRTMIETYENQPVCLLSGRQGYKLASSSVLEATS